MHNADMYEHVVLMNKKAPQQKKQIGINTQPM
jgi:hypothetical protein